ncbi:SDR family oxidoreductase [Emcibacter sp.]|uniref:SDR family oxidoreductase n=1 Tax=Emcibacter sp. TaxID=1979954 RepID=UPI002AA7308A|nr:SDR family NAD(P)-dependent oxidoreductase [Emcibacter sp.]
MNSVKDKLAFITGGASGIGLGIARALLGAGAKVMIADLRADHIENALNALSEEGYGDRVHSINLDVTDREAMAAAVAETERLGGVDILVNNAGVGVEGPFKQATFADWDFGIDVNLRGPVNGVQLFLPGMIERGRGGHIVNTASLAGTLVMPGRFAIYATTKAAVIAFSEAIRGDLAEDNIGVSVLCPGFVRSNIHQAGQNRPEKYRKESGFAEAEVELSQRQAGEDWMDPNEVGDMVLKAILKDQLYVVTHGNFRPQMKDRYEQLMAATPPDPAA